MDALIMTAVLIAGIYILNKISYVFLKNRFIHGRTWSLNICCGKTGVGEVNADIVQHSSEIQGFILVDDIYNLPFEDNRFESILCSHTVEHVENPSRFDQELRRVGKEVHYLIPPLWDVAAAFNFLEHKWIFLTFKTRHKHLPRHVRLPFAKTIHKHFRQIVAA